jgi:hypothetical protein
MSSRGAPISGDQPTSGVQSPENGGFPAASGFSPGEWGGS